MLRNILFYLENGGINVLRNISGDITLLKSRVDGLTVFSDCGAMM
jgi:hypothetical protein